MDESLKARLIGATVLVLLAVALVPEMLSGPKRAADGPPAGKTTRTHVIDLGGAVSAGARLEPRAGDPDPAAPPPNLPAPTAQAAPATATPADASAQDPAPGTLPHSRDEPPAPRAAATPTTTDTDTVARDVPAAETATPAASAVPAGAPSRGGLAVQVGAFGSEATARKLVADLKGDGLPAYIAPLSKGGKTLHRVRVGPVADRTAAEQLAAKLKQRGLPVSVVSGG